MESVFIEIDQRSLSALLCSLLRTVISQILFKTGFAIYSLFLILNIAPETRKSSVLYNSHAFCDETLPMAQPVFDDHPLEEYFRRSCTIYLHTTIVLICLFLFLYCL